MALRDLLVAWEFSLGIGTGLLVDYANSVPAGVERDAVAAAIQEHFTNSVLGDLSIIGTLGNMGWIVAAIAAAVAARRAGHRTLGKWVSLASRHPAWGRPLRPPPYRISNQPTG